MRHPSAKQGLLYLTLIFSGGLPLFSAAQESALETPEAETAPIVIDMAAPLEPERPPPPAPEPSALGVYRSYIDNMEASSGAFAPGLTEQLLGFGLNLQALERHAEAATVLKRGVHVSRVQSGLYAADQLPLLRAEIRSLTVLGRYDEVDERQRYLARVESEALEGTPASIAALLDQGAWAEQAWELRLGEQETHPEHLARSWEYYRLAYNQSSQLFGSESMELLKPLEGMLRLQYRFATLQRANATGSAFDRASSRQPSALGGVYRRGESVLLAIYGLRLFNNVPAGEQAQDLTRLGDWSRWMGRRADARDYYERAWRRITPLPEALEEPSSVASENRASADTPSVQPDPGDRASTQQATSTDAAATTDALALAEPNTASNQTSVAQPDRATAEPVKASSEVETDPASIANAEIENNDATPYVEPPPEDDPLTRAALFETATPLPDIDGLRPLPPYRRDASGPLIVQFQINEAGKITALERLNPAEEIEPVEESENEGAEPREQAATTTELAEDPAADKLLRTMRRVRFRPRYQAGQTVDTGMIVWSFDLTPFD